MAKISQLPSAGALTGTEQVPINQSGTTVQVLLSAIRTWFNASFAASGANSDITSLSGLTTSLSLSQGGTAATSASAARTSLGLVIGTNVPSPTGTGASGTWPISISGNAATASNGGVTSVNGLTGAVTVSGGVTSAVAGNGITVSSATGAVTISQDIYAGTAYNNTSFPIGSYLLVIVNSGLPNLNSTFGSFYASSNAQYAFWGPTNFQGGTGYAISGTWRVRGFAPGPCGGYNTFFIQRVA